MRTAEIVPAVLLALCLGVACNSGDGPQVNRCLNDTLDPDEGGPDCGGVCKALCRDGVLCKVAGDCISGVCTAGSCAVPTCMDGVRNGPEGLVEATPDCGGQCGPCGFSCANACTTGGRCVDAADCESGICARLTAEEPEGRCAPSTCEDGLRNQFESDVDCGSACVTKLCEAGQACEIDQDCESGSCLPDVKRCECVPETPEQLCAAANANCGIISVRDRCGELRDVPCGVACGEGLACSPETNRCTCSAETCVARSACQPATCATAELCAWAMLDGTSCSDGLHCTRDDRCVAGTCVAGAAPTCDDGNPCTDDDCEPNDGSCRYVPDDANTCSDDSACTTGDRCVAGACVVATTTVCEDGNPCTDDGCVAATGLCEFLNHTRGCEDGDLCTLEDACADGACVSGAEKNCSDATACTTDTCESATGECVNAAVTCPEPPVCHASLCDPVTGCGTTPLPDRTSCSATGDRACLGGACRQRYWARTYGGTGIDDFRAAVVAPDGGFVVVGTTRSFGVGAADTLVVKLDDEGQPVWRRTIGHAVDDVESSIVAVADGYVVSTARRQADQGTTNFVYAVKLDSQGLVVWQRAFATGDYVVGTAFHVATDGSIGFFGHTDERGFGEWVLWTLASDGASLSRKGSLNGAVYSGATFPDGFAFGGFHRDGGFHSLITRVGPDLQPRWSRQIPGNVVMAMSPTTGGGVVAAGSMLPQTGLVLLEYAADGAMRKHFRYVSWSDAALMSLVRSANGLVVGAAVTGAGAGGQDILVFEVPDVGAAPTWARYYGGTGDDFLRAVLPLQDGFLLVGQTQSGISHGDWDGWLLRTDATGNVAPGFTLSQPATGIVVQRNETEPTAFPATYTPMASPQAPVAANASVLPLAALPVSTQFP